MTGARERAVGLGLGLAFVLTLARGWQWPNDWAEAQWLFTFEFGFMKRALPGALLNPLLGLAETEAQELTLLRGVTGVAFALFCASLFYVAERVRRREPDERTGALLALVFLSSPFVVMSAHTNGYFDGLTIALSILAGALVLRERVGWAGAVLGVGVLVHETILVVGVPPVLFLALLRTQFDLRASLRTALLLATPALVALVLIVLNQALFLESGELERQLTERIGEFGFVERNRHVLVPQAYTTSFAAFFEQQRGHVMGRLLDFGYALRALPAVLVLGVAAWLRIRASFPLERSALILVAFLGVALVPLGLHAVAWDTSRIWTYPILTAFLALWGLYELEPREAGRTSGPGATAGGHVFDAVLLLLIAHHVLVHTRLMEQKRDRFPLEWRAVLYVVPLALIAWGVSRRSPENGRSAD